MRWPMFLAMALIAAQAALPPDIDDARQTLLREAQRTLENTDEFLRFLESRFADDTAPPKAGVIIMSADAPGDDGLHAVTVLGVHRRSPAYEAGIRPGDRILRIGNRRIEHEPKLVVYMLLDDKPGTVEVELGRAGQRLAVAVERRPMPCLAEAAAHVPLERWLRQLRTSREVLASLVRRLENLHELKPDQYQAALLAAHVGISLSAAMLPETAESVRIALHKATTDACQTTFE